MWWANHMTEQPASQYQIPQQPPEKEGVLFVSGDQLDFHVGSPNAKPLGETQALADAAKAALSSRALWPEHIRTDHETIYSHGATVEQLREQAKNTFLATQPSRKLRFFRTRTVEEVTDEWLLNQEAERVGRTLLSPNEDTSHLFFYQGDSTWFWHNVSTSSKTGTVEKTVRYEVGKDDIRRISVEDDGPHYTSVVGDELHFLHTATSTYVERIRSEIELYKQSDHDLAA